MRNCFYAPGIGYMSLDPSKPCSTGGKDSPTTKPKPSGSGHSERISCRGGEGPYQVIFSDNSTWTGFALTCRQALKQAKRQAPPGVFVVDIWAI